VYAAAVVARFEPQWFTGYRSDAVLSLIRDYANPSTLDPHFTVTRMKDWFEGHSWASGLFSFADCKNQESTSEAVNAYYAVYLFGVAMHLPQLKEFGRVLLATEIRSAQKYWQITDETIYDHEFCKNKVVGMLWSNKVDYSTWFGQNIEFMHCIQMLPFNPISEELLRRLWISKDYEVLKEALDRPDPPIAEGWKGFIFMALAIISQDTAWKNALTLRDFDDGNTRTNTYWWIASRPHSSHAHQRLSSIAASSSYVKIGK